MTENDVSRAFAALEDELGLAPTPTVELDEFFMVPPPPTQVAQIPANVPATSLTKAKAKNKPKLTAPMLLALLALLFSIVMGFVTHSHNQKVDAALSRANIIIADASKEAKSIGNEAQSEAVSIIENAEEEADKIMEET